MFVHPAGVDDACGKASVATPNGRPGVTMQNTVTYTIVVTKHSKGFVATCPALPDCVELGRSRAGVYKAIKERIRHSLTTLITNDRPLPTDPVVSVKHLRINLVEIHKELDLG